jgi:hypothetical protein
MKELRITINKAGQAKVETTGCLGSECQALTAGIEGALGAPVTDELKDEYYAQTDTTHQTEL